LASIIKMTFLLWFTHYNCVTVHFQYLFIYLQTNTIYGICSSYGCSERVISLFEHHRRVLSALCHFAVTLYRPSISQSQICTIAWVNRDNLQLTNLSKIS